MKGFCHTCKVRLETHNTFPSVVKSGYGYCRQCEKALKTARESARESMVWSKPFPRVRLTLRMEDIYGQHT